MGGDGGDGGGGSAASAIHFVVAWIVLSSWVVNVAEPYQKAWIMH
jgi:hypothetical protein